MEDCFISYAQSDYEGKTVEASNDIKEWIGKDASFIDVKESSNYRSQYKRNLISFDAGTSNNYLS